MTEHQYHLKVDAILLHLEDCIDAVEQVDLDYESAGGILTIDFPNGSKIIVNKQPPNLQIWVATKYDGHHFDWLDGQWIDNRSGKEFWLLMSDAASRQANVPITFEPIG